MLNRAQIVTIAGLLLIVVAIGWFDARSSQHPPQQQQAHNSDDSKRNSKSNQIISAETADDKIARYTEWLAILTGGLVATSFIQFVFLIRADKTARIAAEAAKLNAEAVISAERAHLFIVISGNNVHTAMQGVRFYGGEQSASMHDARIPRLMLEFTIKNTGRTAAVLREVSYHFLQADAETTDWRYSFSDTIVVPVIEGNSQTKPVTPCVAESELTIADGRAALDDERPLFFYGFVTFRDTFERDYQYFWRYQYRAGRFALVHEEEQHPPSIY